MPGSRVSWVVSVLALIGGLGCREPGKLAVAGPERHPSRPTAATAQGFAIAGRVSEGGAVLADVRVHYAGSLVDGDSTDADGRFVLTPSGEFARAAALPLVITTSDDRRFSTVIANPGRAVVVELELGDPVVVVVEGASPREQAWIDVFAWAERERQRWNALAPDDLDGRRRVWDAVANTIAAESDPYRRGLYMAGQFGIGRANPDAGLERSGPALQALDQLGLADPRWAIYAWALALAVWESGRWPELGPELDVLVGEHPEPEVAGCLAVERYVTRVSAGEGAEAAAIWSRWTGRRDLARTSFGSIMLGYSPSRTLAPGQSLPLLCVEELGGGQLCLADLRGQVTVLEFWSTWCHGCQTVAAELRQAHAALAGPDAPAFVSIDIYDDPERITEFLAGEPLPWRHGWVREDQRDSVHDRLQLGGIPSLVLIDADGIIVASSPELAAQNLVARVTALTSTTNQ